MQRCHGRSRGFESRRPAMHPKRIGQIIRSATYQSTISQISLSSAGEGTHNRAAPFQPDCSPVVGEPNGRPAILPRSVVRLGALHETLKASESSEYQKSFAIMETLARVIVLYLSSLLWTK